MRKFAFEVAQFEIRAWRSFACVFGWLSILWRKPARQNALPIRVPLSSS